ncbi:MAG: arginase [Myxococcota bacterium]
MQVSITNVHLDLGAGRRGTDMGPSAIHVAGLVPQLTSLGHEVTRVAPIESPGFEHAGDVGNPRARFLGPIERTCRLLADHVEHDVQQGHLPLVLGGDHAQAIGTISGLARAWRQRGERVGVLWIDAHTDMNTPDTTVSGNIHGMPLAALLGHGPAELVALAGEQPALRPEDVAILGVRSVDQTESSLVAQTGVRVYTMSEIDQRGAAACIEEALERVTRHTVGVHLSFDLDGVDPREAPGVGTPVPGGLTIRESHLICERVAQSKKLLGMEMVELNPTLDERNQTGQLAVWLILSAMGKTIL